MRVQGAGEAEEIDCGVDGGQLMMDLAQVRLYLIKSK